MANKARDPERMDSSLPTYAGLNSINTNLNMSTTVNLASAFEPVARQFEQLSPSVDIPFKQERGTDMWTVFAIKIFCFGERNLVSSIIVYASWSHAWGHHIAIQLHSSSQSKRRLAWKVRWKQGPNIMVPRSPPVYFTEYFAEILKWSSLFISTLLQEKFCTVNVLHTEYLAKYSFTNHSDRTFNIPNQGDQFK